VSTGTAPLYQSRGALEETLQTRSASLRIYVKEIVTRVVPGTPTTFFVDRSGHVVAGGAGYRDWASPAVSQLVESLLKTTDSKTEQR